MALNGTGAMEANSTMNQNKEILSRVLEVMEVTAIVIGYTLYTQDFFIHSTL